MGIYVKSKGVLVPLVTSSGGSSSGGDGTSNYSELQNKPSINSVELSGNKTLEELGVSAKEHEHALSEISDITASVDEINRLSGLNGNIMTKLSDLENEIEGKDLSDYVTQTQANQVKSIVFSHTSNQSNPHSTGMMNLSDVDVSGLLDGDAIVYSSETGRFKNASVSISNLGKVRMTSDAAYQYLNEILDGSTILYDEVTGKINVVSLKDLTATIEELNKLSGLDDNIMTKFANFVNGNVQAYPSTFATKADLLAFDFSTLDIDKSYLIYVAMDETKDSSSTIYMCTHLTNSTDNLPSYAGLATATHRDLSVDKVDLTSEVKGVLPAANVDLSGVQMDVDTSELMSIANYDTNGNGIVDKAETLEGLTTTVSDINTSVENSHAHSNKTVLDAIISSGNGKAFLTNAGDYRTFTLEETYEDLDEKPSINGVTLLGDKSSAELNIVIPEIVVGEVSASDTLDASVIRRYSADGKTLYLDFDVPVGMLVDASGEYRNLQFNRYNLEADKTYVIYRSELLSSRPVHIQVYYLDTSETSGLEDILFLNENGTNYISGENIDQENKQGICIKSEWRYNSYILSDTLYETDYIDFSEFSDEVVLKSTEVI